MKRQRAKLANESMRTFRYNTRSSSSRSESKGTSDTNKVEMEKSASSLRVTRRKKKISDDRRTNSDLLPIDLVMEILKRLPVKTLARFLCVSKLWESIIRRRDFMKLFLAESSNRPSRLFFTFRRDHDCFLFENPNTGEDSVATYHKRQPSFVSTIYSAYVHGLICYGTASASELVVYNTSTKRSITLPKFDSQSFVIKPFLGYDPIDGVYKVLCMTGPRLGFQVLTLGNGNEWRVIENSHAYFPVNSQICTNGVLYYEVYADTKCKETAVVSFDVRSEKFGLIKGQGDADDPVDCLSTMIRYEGKLAIMYSKISSNGSMVMWVLEDAVKHEWLKKIFVLPNSWTSLAQDTNRSPHEFHRFFNVTDAGEFILAPLFLFVPPFYVLYYDPKRNSMRKAAIEGILEHKLLRWNKRKLCFLYYLFFSQVESLMLW